MSHFKVGDLVRCVRSDRFQDVYLTPGATITVEAASPNSLCFTGTVLGEEFIGDNDRFELVTPTPPPRT